MTVRPIRTKSRWFNRAKARDPETLAGVASFTAWRLGLNTIKRMRSAHFEIEASPQYFAFLLEYLVFLIQVADRFAFSRLSLPQRRAFTVSMVKGLADQLAENQSRLLGDDYETVRKHFIDHFNGRADDYAALGFDDKYGPDFAFMRYCSSALRDVVAPEDRTWVADQLMTIEAPEAIETLRRVLDTAVTTAGSIGAANDEEPTEPGPLPEMPQVDAPLDDPIPPE
jgi:hypothetical protein